MGTEAPTTIVIPIHCAPKKAPCPKCGKHGHRKRKAVRKVRTVAYKTIAHLEITCGEYTARCDCCTTFRNTPEGGQATGSGQATWSGAVVLTGNGSWPLCLLQ